MLDIFSERQVEVAHTDRYELLLFGRCAIAASDNPDELLHVTLNSSVRFLVPGYISLKEFF